MSRGRGKLKIQWIEEKNARQASFRKRRTTLLEKAEELAALCDVPVAVVVYGPGEAEPTVWPGVTDAKDIMRRYVDLPDSAKETHTLDNEGFMRQRMQKLTRKVQNDELAIRDLEIYLILNDVKLGRRRNLDDLSPELAATIMSVLNLRIKVIDGRMDFFLSSEGAPSVLLPPPEEASLVAASQEPPMVPPLAVTPTVANAPLALPPPPQSALVVAPLEPPMVPPLVVAPTVVDAPPLVLPAAEPHAAASGVGVNEPMSLDGEPRNGSYLLEMVDAIMDDGSGSGVLATAEDVDRVLKEHGLDQFKPM